MADHRQTNLHKGRVTKGLEANYSEDFIKRKHVAFAETKINSQIKGVWLTDSSRAEEKVQDLPRHSVKNAFRIKLQLKNNLFGVQRGEQLKYLGQKPRVNLG